MNASKKFSIITLLLACLFTCGCMYSETNNFPISLPSENSSHALTKARIITEPPAVQMGPSNNVSEAYSITHQADLQSIHQNESDYIEINYVPIDTAQLHANVELARIFYTLAFGMATPDYEEAAVSHKPKIVYNGDTGKRLYYVYCAVNRNNQCIASTAVPATKVLGNLGPGGAIGSGSSDDEMIRTAQEFFDEQYPHANVSSARFVSTCWGELLRVSFKDTNMATEEQVDLLYGSPKPLKHCEKSTDTSTMSKREMDQRISEWEESDRIYRLIVHESAMKGVNLTEPFSHSDYEIMKSVFNQRA